MTASRSSGESLPQGLMDQLLRLLAAHPGFGTGRAVFQLLCQGQAIVLVARRCLQRVRDAVVLSLAKVVHQQISRDRRDPGHKRSPRSVEGAERAIHFDEYFLGQVSRIVGRSGKAIADVIDPAMILLNDFLPSRSVAGNTATDEGIDGLDIVQSALPRGVTPGPIPLTAKDLYEKARPEVRSNQGRLRPLLAFARNSGRADGFRLHCSRGGKVRAVTTRAIEAGKPHRSLT